MAKTISKLNRTSQEQLIAEKNKVISITIQASNNKVKEKMKRVVKKREKVEPIKNKSNVKDVTKTKNNTVTKEASKRKRNEIPRKKLKKNKKGKVRETEEEEEEKGYEIEKLLHDRKCKGVWEIEAKWKDHEKRHGNQ